MIDRAALLALALGLGVSSAAVAQVPKVGRWTLPLRAKPAPAPVVPARVLPALALPADPFGVELNDALLLVLQRNPAANAARIEAQAAGVDVRSAKWQRAPSFSVQGNYYALQGGAPSQTAPAATVDFTLWNAGRTDAVIARATAARRAAEARLQETQLDLTMQVIQNYFEYKRLSERIETIGHDLDDLVSMQDSIGRRYAQGVSPRSDLELARTRTLQVRMTRDALVAQRRGSLQRLRELLIDGDYQISQQGLSPALALRAELEDLIDAADARDPRRRRVEAEAAMASAEAKAASASRFPSLNVEYSYDNIYHHRVGVALKAQATGLAEFTAAKAAALRQGAASERVDVAMHELRTQVTSDYIDYTSALTRLDVATTTSHASDDLRDSYMRQFTAGKRSWLDVMNAVREAMSARLDAIDLRYAAGLAQTRLLVRLGAAPAEPKEQD